MRSFPEKYFARASLARKLEIVNQRYFHTLQPSWMLLRLLLNLKSKGFEPHKSIEFALDFLIQYFSSHALHLVHILPAAYLN